MDAQEFCSKFIKDKGWGFLEYPYTTIVETAEAYHLHKMAELEDIYKQALKEGLNPPGPKYL